MSNTLVFTVNIPTAIVPDPVEASGIRIFPNPVTDILHIDSLKISDQWETLEVWTYQGQRILGPLPIRNQQQLTIRAKHWSKGVYMLVIRGKKKVVYGRVVR